MKINDLEVKKLNEGPIGAGLGAGKSFMQGFKGEKPAEQLAAGANTTLKPIQDAIARLSPQQRAAIRTMVAKKAGVK